MKTLSTTEVTFMAWLGLIGASAAVTEVHAEDAFDGHRLFFTEAQRTQATGSGSDDSSESLPVALVQGPANAGATDVKTRMRVKGRAPVPVRLLVNLVSPRPGLRIPQIATKYILPAL